MNRTMPPRLTPDQGPMGLNSRPILTGSFFQCRPSYGDLRGLSKGDRKLEVSRPSAMAKKPCAKWLSRLILGPKPPVTTVPVPQSSRAAVAIELVIYTKSLTVVTSLASGTSAAKVPAI